jgi:hypothetical protein
VSGADGKGTGAAPRTKTTGAFSAPRHLPRSNNALHMCCIPLLGGIHRRLFAEFGRSQIVYCFQNTISRGSQIFGQRTVPLSQPLWVVG